MKKLILILAVLGLLISCENDDEEIALNNESYVIFGHFYGECGGEDCVATFKLTATKLFEDNVDDYSGEEFEFTELENAKYEQVKDLVDYFPDTLLHQDETIFGCPDCADGGGLLIQYYKNGELRSWRIDQSKENVPTYLHSFMDKVNEKIGVLLQA